MTAPARPRRRRNGSPEGDVQRAVVAFLRAALPPGAILHHSAHEFGRGGRDGQVRQAILQGMGVRAGWADLVILTPGGRSPQVLFLEVKSRTGRASDAQRAFAAEARELGCGWALVRSVEDAADACAAHGVALRGRVT